MLENHPYPPFFNSNTKLLIIGTCPPMRFTQRLEMNDEDVDFYYGSRDNYFWELMCDVFDVDLPWENNSSAIEQRKELMEKHSIGLVDIVKEFTRRDNNASDDNLNVVSYTDIVPILEENIGITKVAFTGGTTESLFSRHLWDYKIHNSVISKTPPKIKEFEVSGRKIKSYTLYSPSPRAVEGVGKVNVIDQYKSALSDL